MVRFIPLILAAAIVGISHAAPTQNKGGEVIAFESESIIFQTVILHNNNPTSTSSSSKTKATTSTTSHETTSTMPHETTTSTKVHETTNSTMPHETTTSTKAHETTTCTSTMAHETTSASTMAHETTTSTMAYETTTSTMTHETTTSTVNRVMAHETTSWLTRLLLLQCSTRLLLRRWPPLPPTPLIIVFNNAWRRPALLRLPAPPSLRQPVLPVKSLSPPLAHTIIVAPSQGVLRYVPFAVNATVGDVLHFNWHADRHRVTRSSVLQICNATQTNAFTTSVNNASFSFDVTVNDTQPVFFYCAVGTHCNQGMFGVVNGEQANSARSAVTVGSMANTLVSADVALKAKWSAVKSLVASNPVANKWGTGISMEGMTNEQMVSVVDNVLFSQLLIHQNMDYVSDNQFSISNSNSPLVLPPADLSTLAKTSSSSGPYSSIIISAGANNTAIDSSSGTTNGAMPTMKFSVATLFASVMAAFAIL
ncbi:hypothetical protein M422DRAFT_27438 [Sphaerobolus stellatus SS14]|nr:hypothetical protein M422DRAFT_27438 [Sphaerobolus stellatus SS14]